MKLKQIKDTILYELHGGSPWGLSSYFDPLECPRKAFLAVQDKEQGIVSSSFAMNRGTAGHAFMDLYESGYDLQSPHQVIFSPGDLISEEEKEAGWDAFVAYAETFGRGSLGVVKATEYLMEGEELSKYIQEAIGLPSNRPYTNRLDMVTFINKKKAHQIYEERGLELEPGPYIVDHKFVTEFSNIEQRLTNANSTLTYVLAGSWKWPSLKGLILNCIHPKKTPTFNTFLIPAPLEDWQIAKVRNAVAAVERIKSDPELTNAAFETAGNCFFPSTCRYQMNGTCQPETRM